MHTTTTTTNTKHTVGNRVPCGRQRTPSARSVRVPPLSSSFIPPTPEKHFHYVHTIYICCHLPNTAVMWGLDSPSCFFFPSHILVHSPTLTHKEILINYTEPHAFSARHGSARRVAVGRGQGGTQTANTGRHPNFMCSGFDVYYSLCIISLGSLDF